MTIHATGEAGSIHAQGCAGRESNDATEERVRQTPEGAELTMVTDHGTVVK